LADCLGYYKLELAVTNPKNRRGHFQLAHPVTIEEVDSDAHKRASLIHSEFIRGFAFIKKHKKSVSIFGSSMITEKDYYYKKAMSLSAKIAQLGYTIVTGGGPGIMEAANRGAFMAGGQSVGLNIKLPREQRSNSYLTDSLEFYYFFSRKVMLSFAAETYIFFPGGYGTLDELFEMMTLIQTNRIAMSVPIILYDKKFWRPFDRLIKQKLLKAYHTIRRDDSKIYCLESDEDKILKIIARAPVVEIIPFKQKI